MVEHVCVLCGIVGWGTVDGQRQDDGGSTDACGKRGYLATYLTQVFMF